MGNMVDLGSRLEGIASKLPLFTNSKLIGIHDTPCGEIPCARSGSVSKFITGNKTAFILGHH